MNRYQRNVIHFFKERNQEFVAWMAGQPSPSTALVVANDIAGSALVFLDHELKHEMKLYETGSRRHGELTDMLIEIHVAKSDQFKTAVTDAAVAVFQGSQD